MPEKYRETDIKNSLSPQSKLLRDCGESFIFTPEMYISSLEIHISKLRMYISSLETKHKPRSADSFHHGLRIVFTTVCG